MSKNGKSPNIILLLADQQRPDTIGPRYTPNLMQISNEGTLFHNAYCPAPLCQPARNAIITGMYGSQTGVCSNRATPISEPQRDDTFMHHLRDGGYRTGLIGKHHFIDHFGDSVDVTDFDDRVAAYGLDFVWQVIDEIENLRNRDHYTRYLQEQGIDLEEYRSFQREHAVPCSEPFPWDEEHFIDAYIAREAMRYVEEYAASGTDQPFYLNVGFIGPHPPYWHPGERVCEPEDTPEPLAAEWTEECRWLRAHYLGRCALIDRWVGKLAETLRTCGLWDDTVLIYSADHGDMWWDRNVWNKRHFFEQVAKVPLIARGPGIRRNSSDSHRYDNRSLVSTLDLYPTILELAGLDPAPHMRHRPGLSIPSILNNVPRAKREAVFSELGTAVMVRTGNWKLVFDPEQGGVQHLYDLRRDPRELDNLAGVPGYDAVRCELLEEILSHRIRLRQYTHDGEERNAQHVRVDG